MEFGQVVKGYIKIYRAIQGHWIWEDKPFSKGQAWIDMLLLANHKDKKVPIGNNLINIGRGQFLTSQQKLAIRWGWSRSKVRAFLELCGKDGQATIQVKAQYYTIITICNYESWQGWETIESPVLEQRIKQLEDQSETSERPVKDINNNIKNVNNEKNENKKEKKGASSSLREKEKIAESLRLKYIRCINNYINHEKPITNNVGKGIASHVGGLEYKPSAQYVRNIINYALPELKDPDWRVLGDAIELYFHEKGEKIELQYVMQIQNFFGRDKDFLTYTPLWDKNAEFAGVVICSDCGGMIYEYIAARMPYKILRCEKCFKRFTGKEYTDLIAKPTKPKEDTDPSELRAGETIDDFGKRRGEELKTQTERN